MPTKPVYITMTSSGVSRVVNMDFNSNSPFNATVGAVYGSTTMTATYGIEYTLLDQQTLRQYGSTQAIIFFPDANLPTGTTSAATSNYLFPIAGVRFTLSAISSSYVTFCVLQG